MKTIIVADDSHIIVNIVKRAFEGEYNVISAENGQEALELFQTSEEGTFDAILMDVRMPIMDGIEATKQIRNLSQKDAKTIPIIAMTANAYDEDKQRTYEAGMNAHLAKPIEPRVLYQTLAEQLS